MTIITELNAAAARYYRSLLYAVVGSLVLLFSVKELTDTYHDVILTFLERTMSASIAENLLEFRQLPTLFVLFIGVYRADRILREVSSLCPHCRKQIVTIRYYVIASGNCPHCGNCVLSDSNRLPVVESR